MSSAPATGRDVIAGSSREGAALPHVAVSSSKATAASAARPNTELLVT